MDILLKYSLLGLPSSILTSFALTLSLFGCSLERADRLKISHSQWPGYEYLNLAVSKGYLPGVEIVSLTDQSEVVRSYLRGDLDIVQLTTVEILEICSKQIEKCPVIVLVLDESVGGDQIMSLKIDSISNLRGAKVAVATDSFGPFVMQQALKSINSSIDDIRMMPMLVSEMPSALSSGEIDAAVLYPPNSEIVRSIGAKTIFDSSEIPGQILDVLAVSPSVYSARSEDISEIVSGWFKAHEYALNNEASAIAFMASSLNLSTDELRKILNGLAFYPTVKEQLALMQTKDDVALNIEDVKQSLKELNFISAGTPSPKVTDRFLP